MAQIALHTLVGTALTDPEFCHDLLNGRRPTLLTKFELTDEERTTRMRTMWLEEWMPLSFANQETAQESLDRIFDGAEFSWPHAQYSQQENPAFDA